MWPFSPSMKRNVCAWSIGPVRGFSRQTDQQLMGLTAVELGLHECLEGEAARTLQKSFPWEIGEVGTTPKCLS